MNIYEKKFRWKVLLMILALAIVAVTFWYTNTLANKIAIEEKKKVEQFAKATLLQVAASNPEEIKFFQNIVRGNTTIPVILTDENNEIQSFRNLDSTKIARDSNYLKKKLVEFESKNKPIEITETIEVGGVQVAPNQKIFFDNSILYTQLRYYPIIQLGLIGLFLSIGYLAFSSARKAEQNQVWVGMAKETAHQLGTPLSSLVGWVEYLKMKEKDNENSIANEIQKDVKRLELIAERFSKIGSAPKLEKIDINQEIEKTINYAKRRASDKIEFSFNKIEPEQFVNLSPPLFDWVVENILKNALDAMENTGNIAVDVKKQNNQVLIDLFNSGKYIPKSKWSTIFQPGYSTKKRGWGLGLSLSKRIIEEYHKGKIFVKNSAENEGTTFRIIMPIA